MRLSEGIQKFFEAKEGLLRPATIGMYRHAFGELMTFLGDVEIGRVTADALRRYRGELSQRTERHSTNAHRETLQGGLAIATINNLLTRARVLFRFLFTEGYLTVNPAETLKKIPLPPRPPKAITDNDLALMFRAALTNPDVIAGVRDYALVRLLAETGCRLGGILGLRLCDVDLVKGEAMVHEKGDKWRRVYFSPDTSAALVRYLGHHPGARLIGWQIEVTDPTAPLWRGRQGDWAYHAATKVLRRMAKRAKVQGKFNAHSFRHRFALNYLNNGGDLASLSQLMGHSNMRVTEEYYARFSGDELHEKHERFITVPDATEITDLPKKPRAPKAQKRKAKRPKGQTGRGKAAGGAA